MFGVFTVTLTHFLAKTIFSRGFLGCTLYLWKFRRGGFFFVCSKNGNSGKEGARTQNSLRDGGMDIFCNYTMYI